MIFLDRFLAWLGSGDPAASHPVHQSKCPAPGLKAPSPGKSPLLQQQLLLFGISDEEDADSAALASAAHRTSPAPSTLSSPPSKPVSDKKASMLLPAREKKQSRKTSAKPQRGSPDPSAYRSVDRNPGATKQKALFEKAGLSADSSLMNSSKRLSTSERQSQQSAATPAFASNDGEPYVASVVSPTGANSPLKLEMPASGEESSPKVSPKGPSTIQKLEAALAVSKYNREQRQPGEKRDSPIAQSVLTPRNKVILLSPRSPNLKSSKVTPDTKGSKSSLI